MSMLRRLFRTRDASAASGHPALGTPDAAPIATTVAELRLAGDDTRAMALLQDALVREPAAPAMRFARADVLFDHGRHREALIDYAGAVDVVSKDVVAAVRVGWACLYCGDVGGAENWMRTALALNAEEPTALFGLAVVFTRQKRFVAAVETFQRALGARANEAECQIGLGNVHMDQGAYALAEQHFRNATVLDASSAHAWGLLGVALDRVGASEAGLEAARLAVALDEQQGELTDRSLKLAIDLAEGRDYSQAFKYFEQALPVRHTLHGYVGYGTTLLAAGRWLEGWPYYQFRFIIEPQVSHRPPFVRPWWNGQNLRGKTILLHVEQGLGDIIQFVRYAPLVKALGATVLLVVSRMLLNLARGFNGVDRVLGPGEASPDFAYYVHLLSLPRLFATTPETVPQLVPYVSVDADRLHDAVVQVAREAGGQFTVGVVWSGSAANVYNARRAIPLAAMAPLLELPGTRWFSLQREGEAIAPEDAMYVEGLAKLELRNDLVGTAALLDSLDLLITVDTSLAHLAGALGKPVWLLLPLKAHWVWLEERNDSPWYPTMTLYRQRESGNWVEVIERVKVALETVLRAGGASALPCRPRPSATLPKPVDLLPRMADTYRPGFAAVAEARHGVLQYLPDEPDIGDALAWYGEWLESELSMFERLLMPGATVLEFGAGVGAHAMPVGKALGAHGHLIVWEADAAMSNILRHNFGANRVENVTFLRDEPGSAHGPYGTIDNLFLERLDWIKVDRAGLATSALAGATNTIWRLRPRWFLSVSEEQHSQEIVASLKLLAYRCWGMESELYRPDNFNRRSDDIFDGRIARSVIAIPEEIEPDEALRQCVEL
jgi:tetratricopeptide (TPR) repeat protein